MKLVHIYQNNDFSNVIVPEGQAVIFFTSNGNGGIIKKYKDSNGNFGTC